MSQTHITPTVYWQEVIQDEIQDEIRLKQEEIQYAVLRREWERRFPADELSDEEVIPQSPPTGRRFVCPMRRQNQINEQISRNKALARRFPADELSDNEVIHVAESPPQSPR